MRVLCRVWRRQMLNARNNTHTTQSTRTTTTTHPTCPHTRTHRCREKILAYGRLDSLRTGRCDKCNLRHTSDVVN